VNAALKEKKLVMFKAKVYYLKQKIILYIYLEGARIPLELKTTLDATNATPYTALHNLDKAKTYKADFLEDSDI
jgi:hypothetical protein